VTNLASNSFIRSCQGLARTKHKQVLENMLGKYYGTPIRDIKRSKGNV